MTLLFRYPPQQPPLPLSRSFYETKTAAVTLLGVLFLNSARFLKYKNGILFAAVPASKRLFVIIQIYAAIQGHLYHFKLFGCSSSGAGHTILRETQASPPPPAPPAAPAHPESSETVMIVTASESTCFQS